MAQIIKHRRGSLEKLSEVTGSLQKGEIVIATGSANLTTTNGSALAFIVPESGSVQASNRFLMGSSDPAVFSASTYNGMVKGVPYYASGSKTLFLLGSDGNEAINLVGNIQPFSGSVNTRLGDLEASIGGGTSGIGTRVTNLETISASYLEFTQSYYTDSASVATQFSASSASQTALSASIATTDSASAASVVALSASVVALSASAASALDTLSGSVYTQFSASGASVTALSASIATTDSASAASVLALSTSVDSRLDSLEFNDTRFATTGSNIFFGTQVITGSVFISQNLIVQGSSSLQNITASAVSIGTNRILLNTDTPAVRYAGISVFDSGSTNVTASLFYDGLTNNWKFEHNDTGTNDASIVLFGPLGTGIDNAPTLSANFLTKVEDNGHGHHLTTSSVSDDGTKVTINNPLDVIGEISSSTIAGIGNVTLYSQSVDSRVATLETSLGGGGSIGTRVANLETISGSYLAFTQSYYTDSASFDTRISASVASITANSSSSATSFSASLASQTALSASSYSTFAKLSGGNTFTGTQTVSGSFNVSGSSNFGGAVAVDNSNMNLTNSSSLNLTSGSSLFVNGNGVISGSIVGIGNVSEFSQSVDSRLDSVEESLGGGGSIGTRVGNLETISASYLAFTQSYYSDSASVATSFSASAFTATINSASAATDFNALSSSTFTQFSASAATATANSASAGTSISASNAQIAALSASVASTTGEFSGSIYTQFSASAFTATANSASAATDFNTLSGSTYTQFSASAASVTANSASAATSFSASLASQTALSASVAATDNGQTDRIVKLEASQSAFDSAIELTGSNVTIQGDLLVRGTTTSVNSTTIELGDNIIELNGSGAANGGLYVKDVTAPNTATGSLIWDSTNDYWKAGVKDTESKVLLATGDNVFTSSIQTALSGTFGYSTFDTAISTSFSASAASVASLSASVASVTGDFSSSIATSFSASAFTVTANSASAATSFSASLASQTELSSSLDSRVATLEGSGSIQGVGTSDNVSFNSVTASLNVPGGSSTKRLAFRGLTDNIEFVAAPTQSGDIAQWNGTDFVMSNVIDGGSF